MADAIKFMTLDVWGTNETWIRDYINREDAKSLKTVALSSDGKKLLFYKIINPTSDSVPAYEITIPAPDLDTVIKKITGAVEGDVAVFDSTGAIKDTGLKVTDIPTSATVEQMIAEKLANLSHMKKEIVQELPNAADADANTFYLIKIDSVTGTDKYEIWTLIGNELVLIDDTSIDLSNYVTSDIMSNSISTAKAEAISEAVAQADSSAQAKTDKALADAKIYTDSLVNPLTNRVAALETDVDNAENSILTINQTLTAHSDRIGALETEVGNMEVATVEEALAVFNSVFETS